VDYIFAFNMELKCFIYVFLGPQLVQLHL
ncbi:hypothetical protein CCACVL1_11070, partial [Corchorus capsularis]